MFTGGGNGEEGWDIFIGVINSVNLHTCFSTAECSLIEMRFTQINRR